MNKTNITLKSNYSNWISDSVRRLYINKFHNRPACENTGNRVTQKSLLP